MRENYRKPIASKEKFPQFITMNVIDGQAGLARYSSLIFYSLTINNILNIIILVILAAVSIRAVYNMGIVGHAINGTQQYAERAKEENEMMGETVTKLEDAVSKVKEIQNGNGKLPEEDITYYGEIKAVNDYFLLRKNGELKQIRDYNQTTSDQFKIEDIEGELVASNVKAICENFYITNDGKLFELNNGASVLVMNNVQNVRIDNDGELLFINDVFLYFRTYNEETGEYDIVLISDDVKNAYLSSVNSLSYRIISYENNDDDIFLWFCPEDGDLNEDSSSLNITTDVKYILGCPLDGKYYYITKSNSLHSLEDSNIIIDNVKYVYGNWIGVFNSGMKYRGFCLVLDNYGKLFLWNREYNHRNLYEYEGDDLFHKRVKNISKNNNEGTILYDYDGNKYGIDYDTGNVINLGITEDPNSISETTEGIDQGIIQNNSKGAIIENEIKYYIGCGNPENMVENYQDYYTYTTNNYIYRLTYQNQKWNIEAEEKVVDSGR